MKKLTTYNSRYLYKLLVENDHPRKNDLQFILERDEASSAEFERRRLEGMTVFEADECAMKVLTADLFPETQQA